ncbi:MAG: TetR/AcrR family transcriptional regulator, partial [Acidobacteriota bacterium]
SAAVCGGGPDRFSPTMLAHVQPGKIDVRDLLATFGQYGFRKTSMQDIADAVGLSRQSIYKKFGSKEACYRWTIKAYLADMYGRIFDVLETDEAAAAAPQVTLQRVFDIFIGEAVELVRRPHGTEVLDDTLEATHASEEQWPSSFRKRLGDFLHRHGLASSPERGKSKAFVMITSAKGLLLEVPSQERFREEMGRILTILVGELD